MESITIISALQCIEQVIEIEKKIAKSLLLMAILIRGNIQNNMETWKDIIGYEDLYQVSSFGRIRNKAGRVLKPEFHHNGYFRVDLCKDKVCIKQYIHRIVATVFFENPTDLPLVNHKDMNKQNNSIENLEWATYAYNTQHYYRNKMRSIPVLIDIIPEDDINPEDIPW